MRTKKGIEQSALVKIIGIVASFVVIALLFKNIFYVTYGETAENVCRMSVVSHANTQVAGSPVMNLKCPRKFITFDNEGYKQYYADELPIDKDKLSYNTKFKDNIPVKAQFYKIMADEMAECWYKLGEGEMDVFQEDLLFKRPSCLICSQVDFSKEFEKNTDLGTIGEFDEYLRTHNFTKYGINQGYRDFLYKNYQSSLSIRWLSFYNQEDSVQIMFDENTPLKAKPYLIYFKGYKFDKTNKVLNYLGESLVGESINRIFPNDRYFVFFSGQEDITKSCYMMVN